ncbi:Flagellar biosynthetic protein FliR [Buchnera aphidicola (Cinara cuneomaculata)]|uniref:Flagellar biosynthetic protein FliR n=1 Tax=Buchnera aphidicola (Cinara cuneomaculata) TaxID=1660040 RepID=A0A451CXH9_9GAMM|nr:flagellar biosynthetic protein FliR [Buchnera aphidicola]VFP78037.1 Flagellar biosynthetic protein FliR [Buchnera aphidicola (Cinara cuneomaculata)]
MINHLFYKHIFGMDSKILLIMSRIYSILMYSKIFSYISDNASIKFFFIYVTSHLLAPFVSDYNINHYDIEFLMILCNQILIGMAIGLLFQCLFSCIIFIGEIISSQIGLSFSVFFDLGFHVYSLVLSNLLNIFFLFSFFVYNGHLKLIIFLIKSFQVFPLYNTSIDRNIIWSIIHFSSLIFLNGVYCVLPILFFFLILFIACMVLNRIVPSTSLFSSFSVIIFIVGMILLKYFIFKFYGISKILFDYLFHYLKIYGFKLLWHK